MVVSGRTEETLAAAAGQLGDAVVTVVADNADPATPRRLIAAAQRALGPARRRPDQRRGPAQGAGHRDRRRAVDPRRSSRSSSARSGCAARSALALGDGGVARAGALLSVRAPLADMAISNGLRPGLAMVAKTLADELGPRGVRVNGLLPGRVGTERVAELDAATGDPEAARAAADPGHPAGPLRRAGGVRPGRGVPALAGRVVRHRRHAAGRRRACCARSELRQLAPPARCVVGGRSSATHAGAALACRRAHSSYSR